MRYFRYNEQGDPENVVVTISEEQILREYFPWWKRQLERSGKTHLISEENCLEDWQATNWAWEVFDIHLEQS
jgi:hypothetical protein